MKNKSSKIYRQAALDRLASPEKLDQPFQLVGTPGWFALIAMLIAIVGFSVWGVYARVPVKVFAQGITLPEGGLLEIVANSSGRIKALSLKLGQEIREGEIIASFQRADLERELRKGKTELADAILRQTEIAMFYKGVEERNIIAERERLDTISQTQSFVTRRHKLLVKRSESIRSLLQRKIVHGDKMIEVELLRTRAQERLSELDDEAKTITLQRLQSQSKQRLALIDENLKVDRLARQVQRLEEQLDDKRIIRSPHTGKVVELSVDRGDVVTPGTLLSTLAPIEALDQKTFGLIYVPPAQGKRIKIGMSVETEPSTVSREEFGFILGKVVRVSPVPVTIKGMRNTLKNEKLVEQLAGNGAPFEVRVNFQPDALTSSGLKWSSSSGPDAPLHAGALLNARIIVEHIPLIDMVIPGFSKNLGFNELSRIIN